jgi:hypothetical protein
MMKLKRRKPGQSSWSSWTVVITVLVFLAGIMRYLSPVRDTLAGAPPKNVPGSWTRLGLCRKKANLEQDIIGNPILVTNVGDLSYLSFSTYNIYMRGMKLPLSSGPVDQSMTFCIPYKSTCASFLETASKKKGVQTPIFSWHQGFCGSVRRGCTCSLWSPQNYSCLHHSFKAIEEHLVNAPSKAQWQFISS